MKDKPIFFLHLFFYSFIASCFFVSLGQLEDHDIWWQLKAGQWMLDNLRAPHTQLFSYAIDGVSWVNHSWLFQALIFAVYKFLGGINSLIVFKAIMVGLVLWITLKGFLKKVYPPLFLLSAWLFSRLFLIRAPLRPELISALFLSLYLYALFNKRNLWFLLIIQCLWANMHGYFALGPIVLSLFIFSEYIKLKIKLPLDWNKTVYLTDKAAYGKYLIILAAAVLLSFLSPYGINNLRYPFFAVKSFLYGSGNFYSVSELSSLRLTDILFTNKHALLKSAVALFAVSLLLNIRKANLFNMLIFVGFFSLYCTANRHSGFFAVIGCFCVLDNFQTGNYDFLKPYFKIRHAGILTIILTSLIGAYILRYQFVRERELRKKYVYSEDLGSKSYRYGIDTSIFPVKAVDFILKNRITDPIFNSFNISGYLIWRLYPSCKVFIDGRTEIYGKVFMDEYVHSIIDFRKWQELDEKYGFNTVILDYSTTDLYFPLIRKLYEDSRWKLVYFGEIAVIFMKDDLANKSVIATHGMLFEDSKGAVPTGHLIDGKETAAYPAHFLNRARFFINAMDMPGLALKNLERARHINHECYEVYQLTGYTYFKMKKFKEAEVAFTKSLQINPNIAEPYLNLGSVAAEMGLHKKASLLYKQALSLDKYNKVARDNLDKLPKQGF